MIRYFLRKPIILFCLINVLIFALIFFRLDTPDYNILVIGGGCLAITLIIYTTFSRLRFGDNYLFILASMLVMFGVAMLCRIDYAIGYKQIIWYAVALICFLISFFVFINVKRWDGGFWWFFGGAVFLLILTQLIGKTVSGSKNWIVIGGYSIQPSEIVKVLFSFFLAISLSRKKMKTYTKYHIQEKYVVMMCVYVVCFFFVLQREWGSMVLFFLTYLLALFVHSEQALILTSNFTLMSLAVWFAATNLSHIQTRISNWLAPFGDITNKSFQTAQSLFAISSGGFFGTGLGLGHPEYIPAVHSDFIFSSICEEMGVFGGCAVIILFFLLVYRGFKIAIASRGFDKYLALIIATMFGLQTFIIIGGVINLIPLTGITLPFVSYGGSSLVTTFISLGLLQAISYKTQRVAAVV